MNSAFRIMLALPGREVQLYAYKRPVDFQLAHRKMAEFASTMMASWSWNTDSDCVAIEDQDHSDMMLLLLSSDERKPVECTL